jgi:hypothetical protein
MTGFALEMLRPGPLIVGLIKQRFFSLTKRELRETKGPWFFDFPVQYARKLLVFLIATVFSTLSPLVLPFALIFFFLSWMSSKYLLCFVCTPVNPAQGSIFPSLFSRLCWSLIVFQVVLFGVLGGAVLFVFLFSLFSLRYLGRNFFGAIALVPLVVMQTLFWLWTDKQLHNGAKYGSLEGDAAAVYSKEEAYMKKHVERRMAKSALSSDPLLLEEDESDEEEEEWSDELAHLLPHSDTYSFVTQRKPLFQLESQEDASSTISVASLFWPTIWERTEQPAMAVVAPTWKRPGARRRGSKAVTFVETL